MFTPFPGGRSMGAKQVRKRDGTLVPFDQRRIEGAIQRAAFEVLQNKKRAARIAFTVTDVVVKKIETSFRDQVPTVEGI